MFDLFILAGMMMGFMISSLLWEQWQALTALLEVQQGAGIFNWFKEKTVTHRQRSTPSISRQELEDQYIRVMQKGGSQPQGLQNIDTITSLEGSNFEGREELFESENDSTVPNEIFSTLEGGSNMVDLQQVPGGIELIKVPVVVGENTTQQMLVTDLELDFCAIKVRDIDASVRDLVATVIHDKVIVQGILHKQIFYVDQENVVRHQPEDIPFSFFVDIPGAEPGMDVEIRPVIEHIKTELLECGCILHQKVVIEFFVKVTTTEQIFVEVGTGPLVKVERVIGENSVQTLVPSTLDLPVPAIKIVDIDARVQDVTCEVITDKVIIQGIVHKQVYFISPDNIERHIAENIPFSTFVDVPGAEPGLNCQVHPTIEFIKRELIEAGTVLQQEVVLEVFVKVTETVQLHLTTGEDILLKVPLVIGENVRQILIENTVQLPVRAIKIKEIDASVRDIRTTIINDKVIIQGIVHKQIFFVDEANIERHFGEDVPFSTFVDLPGAEPGMNADITPIIEFVKPELCPPSDLLTQKVVVEIFVKVTQTIQITVPRVAPGPYGPYGLGA